MLEPEPGVSRRNKFRAKCVSIPRGPMVWCDNRCSEKALRFWQFASVVVDDVKESYTVNLCQQCYNERLTALEGRRGKEGASWQTMENVGNGPIYTRSVSISLWQERKR